MASEAELIERDATTERLKASDAAKARESPPAKSRGGGVPLRLSFGGLSQSEWILIAILAGFLVYLAIKGKLGVYWTLLTGGAAASSSTSSTSSTVGSVAGAVAGAVTGSAVPPGASSSASTASSSVGGTITNNGQTVATTFPTIPGTSVAMPQVTF
jgi:hypothetical protein